MEKNLCQTGKLVAKKKTLQSRGEFFIEGVVYLGPRKLGFACLMRGKLVNILSPQMAMNPMVQKGTT